MAPPGEFVLVTKIKTGNKGNQALSAGWLRMLQKSLPQCKARIFERKPQHLLQYSLRAISRAADPFAAFDAIAEDLAKLAPGPDFIGDVISEPRIELDERIAPPARFAELRNRLNLRSWAARAGRYREGYRRRLSAFQRASLVVLNPAGEFFPRRPEPAFYHLLDAFVAHKLGSPTAIVNHTMEIDDPTLRRIIPKIYRQLKLIGFRENKSLAAFKEMGGDLGNVLVTPDLALTTEYSNKSISVPSKVGVAIHTQEAEAGGYLMGWYDVIERLLANGFQVSLLSNELSTDLPFYQKIHSRFSTVKIEGKGLEYERYCDLLATYNFIVTSRMHTGILAMVCSTPIVPIEPTHFKMTGLFQELGVGTPVIRPLENGWVNRAIEQSLVLQKNREEVSKDLVKRISAVQERISRDLVPKLQEAASVQVHEKTNLFLSAF